MQTWLPYSDFAASARVLRNQELGRQRVDAKLAINALLFPHRKSKWRFHPVCRMWKGYENALINYYHAIVREWMLRGFKHQAGVPNQRAGFVDQPWWLFTSLTNNHQAVLIHRWPEYYKKKFPPMYSEERVIWPVKRDGTRSAHIVRGGAWLP